MASGKCSQPTWRLIDEPVAIYRPGWICFLGSAALGGQVAAGNPSSADVAALSLKSVGKATSVETLAVFLRNSLEKEFLIL